MGRLAVHMARGKRSTGKTAAPEKEKERKREGKQENDKRKLNCVTFSRIYVGGWEGRARDTGRDGDGSEDCSFLY